MCGYCCAMHSGACDVLQQCFLDNLEEPLPFWLFHETSDSNMYGDNINSSDSDVESSSRSSKSISSPLRDPHDDALEPTESALAFLFLDQDSDRVTINLSGCEISVYDEVKDMIYTHATLCESMRLYPAVPTAQLMENKLHKMMCCEMEQ
ncbi:hypothetical protein POM88_024373 [Heracleum sosnowskyi]|uniref:Uncharacterized protein n=1 Tax=Heracleum sosnowskyi TaxID=360622 RepID=A0AAD8MM87_9APIA|nr:hypothetical protein POM88_024373 [Heracleum sosnowskyi]